MLNLKKVANKYISRIKKSKIAKVFGIFLLSIISLLSLYGFMFNDRIFPGVYISNTYVGGKTYKEAFVLLQNETFPGSAVLKSGEEGYEIMLNDIDLVFNTDSSVQAAFVYFRTGNIIEDQKRRIMVPFAKKKFGFRLSLNREKLNQKLIEVIKDVSTSPVYPSVEFVDGVPVVNKGEVGTTVDIQNLRANLESNLSYLTNTPVEIEKEIVDRRITDEEAELLRNRALTLVGRTLVLTHEFDSFSFREKELFSLLNPSGEYKKEELTKLISDLASSVNREPQNSQFVFGGGKVTEFLPSKDGIKIKEEVLMEMIIGNLHSFENSDEVTISINIPVFSFPPEITTDQVNNLGINELIGRGTSKFAGSISSRIYNIGHASRTIDGTLIPPGHIFSFNGTVGDVSTLTGYKQAYVIKDGATVLGDGGGLCQVSTTLFRAALNAGLPITERRAHSYRVGYYEQGSPLGLDATVYSPTTDFKFRNDTPGHLLIQTYFYPKNSSLVFEIYGTSDGRESSISKSIVWDVSPPPEDLYTDDPTLPTGQVKQIDYKSWGAKAKFTYTVKKAGEIIINRVFSSVYQPWQAKFLRGTGPVN